MKEISDRNKYFWTTSQQLARCLYIKGQAIAGVSSNKEFVFVRSSYLQELESLMGVHGFHKRNPDDALMLVRVYERARSDGFDELLNRTPKQELNKQWICPCEICASQDAQ